MNLATLNLTPSKNQDFENYIRTVPDFPKKGINFKDIAPLLAAPEKFKELIELLAQEIKQSEANKIVGLESRGFIIGIAVAQHLGLPFVPARKAGKLPGETISISYGLEYGQSVLELQRDSINAHDSVAIVDDLLATGGTAQAASKIVEFLGGKVAGYFFAIELEALPGRSALGNSLIRSVLKL